MNDSVYRITLDMHETASQVLLKLKKNDSCRRIIITFTDSGRPYRIEDGCIATLRARKPDGEILYNGCIVDGNVLTYFLTNQTSASVGIVECEVTLYDGDLRQITSPRFSLCVEDTLYSDSEIESTNEFTALTDAMVAASRIDADLINVEEGAEIVITDRDGNEHRKTILNGAKGDRGEDGINGVAVAADGMFAFNVTEEGILQVSYTGNDAPTFCLGDDGHMYAVFEEGDSSGQPGSGESGGNVCTGHTPVRGEDYWTEEDIAQIQSYIDQQIGGVLNGTY